MSITSLPRVRHLDRRRDSGPSDPNEDSSQPDDSFLALAISRGDTMALERLIARYWNPLTSYASRIIDDMAVAEDVVQQVFVTIWKDRGEWSPRAVRAYLFRCTRNLALDERRSWLARHRREAKAEEVRPSHPALPDALLEQRAIAEAVDAAIQQLPERRREAFVLAYLKGLSYSEVAEVMGVATKTVAHHVSAALAELRVALHGIAAEGEAYPSEQHKPTALPLRRS